MHTRDKKRKQPEESVEKETISHELKKKKKTHKSPVETTKAQYELPAESKTKSKPLEILNMFDQVIIEDDGNCLFRAILYCLCRDDSSHAALRERVCEYMDQNKEIYRDAIADQSIEDYIEKMKLSRTWGDHLELFIASELLSFNFQVYRSDSLVPYYEHVNNLEYGTIYMEYFNLNHYNSLFLKTQPKTHIDLKKKIQKSSTNSYRSFISSLKRKISSYKENANEVLNAYKKCMSKVPSNDEKTSSCKEDAKEVLNTYNKCMSKDESNEKKKSVKVTTTSLRKPVKENVYNNVQTMSSLDMNSLDNNEKDSSEYYDSDLDSDFYPSESSESEILSESDDEDDEIELSLLESDEDNGKIIKCNPKFLYMNAKGGSDAYNEVYRYLKYNIVPKRFENNSKGLRDWKKGIVYYLNTKPKCRSSNSLLGFRSKTHGDVTIPFRSEVENLISHAHYGSDDPSLIRHNGINTILSDLYDKKLYWAGMSDDIRDFVAVCVECNEQLIEKPIKNPKIIISNGPLHRLIADLWQIPKAISEAASTQNHPYYKYVMVCVDHFSKYTWGILLEDKEAKTITTQLNLIFNQFGKPEIFQSDNGTEFQNSLLKTLCEKLGIKKIHGSVRHPQSQGAAEKLNDFMAKSVRHAFRSYTRSETKNRFQIELAAKAFIDNQNQKVHSITGCRPNKLLLTEDEDIIKSVNNKVKTHYEKKINIKTRYNIKPGMKIFLIGDLKVEAGTDKIVPDIPKLKNKLEKQQRPLKILAKVVNIEHIQRNEIVVKIYKRPRNGMLLNREYRILVNHVAVAKSLRWESLMNAKE